MSPLAGLSIAALGLLLLVCSTQHKPQILEKLASRSAAALRTAGIDPTGFAMDPDRRIAVLRGVADSAIVSEQAQRTLRELPGVHDVRVEILPSPAPPPPPESKRVEQQLREIVQLENVQFETNSATLTPKGVATMEKIAAVLKQATGFPVEIQGHTDGRGDRAYNLALSQQRANTCLQFLTARGLPAARFSAKGYGPDRPVATNESEEGRLQNRRIEFSVKEVEIKREAK
jgi:outer membrane protein OmpA-like peptidoglycan-associated protein